MIQDRLIALGLCVLSMTVVADDLVFDGGSPSSGVWESPLNWSPDQTPGPNDSAFVGGNFTALLSQTGQAVNVLYIGHDNTPSPGPGTLILSSGSFSSTTARVGTSTNVVIRNPGTYQIDGGTWNVGHGGAVVGHSANGTFNLSGGTVQSAAGLEIGWTDTTGVVSMIGGTYNLSAGGLQVGKGGAGTFNMSGGTIQVTDGVDVGAAAGGVGTFNINNGTFGLNDGTFGILSGGLSVGDTAGATGHAGIGSGTFTIAGGGVQVGRGGAGTFTISGGTVQVADGVDVGEAAGGVGTFNISGGTVNVPNGGMRVGKAGAGTFNLTGGTVQVLDGVEVGAAAGGAGTFTMSGGTYGISSVGFAVGSATGATGYADIGLGTFTIAGGGVQVGRGGAGTFTISGGTVQVADGVDVCEAAGGVGTFDLSSGTVNLNGGGLRVGSVSSARGTFNFTGGVIGIRTGNAEVAYAAGGAGTFNLVGGTMFMRDGSLLIGVDALSSNASVVLDGSVLDLNRGVVRLAGSEHASNQFSFTSGTLGNVSTFAGDLHHRGGRLDIGHEVASMMIQTNGDMAGSYLVYAPAELRIKIHGTAGPGVPDGHDQIEVFGGVDLNAGGTGGGNLLVRVDKPLLASAVGATFVIIENRSTSQVDGVFANATGHQVDGSNGEVFTVDYAYDSGGDQRSNDVALVLLSIATAPVPPYVPDAWKLSHWESVYLYPGDEVDSDVDTQASLDEYIAGTDPNDPGSFFQIADHTAAEASAAVYLNTVTGRVYHVDGSGDLQDGEGWVPVSTNIPGSGAQVLVPDTSSVFRVYRARVNLAP